MSSFQFLSTPALPLQRVGVLIALVVSMISMTTAMSTAHAAVPLPVDVNCTFSYGFTLSPVNGVETEIDNYGGATSCSRSSLYFMDAGSYLQEVAPTGNDYQDGPYSSCYVCGSRSSYGGPFGPVPDGTVWRMTYYTNLYMSNATWVSWDPSACKPLENLHWLQCYYSLDVTLLPRVTTRYQITSTSAAVGTD
jgi:hypothetical protein